MPTRWDLFFLGVFLVIGVPIIIGVHENSQYERTYKEANNPYEDVLTLKLGHKWYNNRTDEYAIKFRYGGIVNNKYLFTNVIIGNYIYGRGSGFDLYLPQNENIVNLDPIFMEVVSATPTETQLKIKYPYHELPEPFGPMSGILLWCFSGGLLGLLPILESGVV